MKHSLTYTIAGALVAALLTSTAFADTIVNKGALGKYERKGQFLKPIMSPPARTVGGTQTDLVHNGSVVIDKGELGTYERQGRFVRPIVEDVQNSWSSGSTSKYFPEKKSPSKVRLGLPRR